MMKKQTRRVGAAFASSAAALIALGLGASLSRRRARRPLRGATCVVCGASRGLGRAIALELGRRGARVGICARTRSDLEAVAAELEGRGVEVVAAVVDLRSEEATERFLADVTERLGPIDVLVTNAATIGVGPAATFTREDYDEAIGSIFHTALHPVLAVMPAMRRRGAGTIAFVTSIGAKVGVPHLAPYCAAKFATLGLAETLRAELAADGVRVLTVVPGLMRTGSILHATFKGQHEREYTWFGAAATAPVLSIDADVAARRIARAIERGATEIAFTPEARLAPVVRALAPGLFAGAMSLASRLLPRPPPFPRAIERREGAEIVREGSSDVARAVTARNRPFAERHAQT